MENMITLSVSYNIVIIMIRLADNTK